MLETKELLISFYSYLKIVNIKMFNIVNSIIKVCNKWWRNQFHDTLESEHSVPGTTPIR